MTLLFIIPKKNDNFAARNYLNEMKIGVGL